MNDGWSVVRTNHRPRSKKGYVGAPFDLQVESIEKPLANVVHV